MRSARTGKYHGSGHHCTGGGRTPRPRLPAWPQFMRGFYSRLLQPAVHDATRNCSARAAGKPLCSLPRRTRGPLIDPERLTECLLRRDTFTPAASQNILAAAWPAFYRRVARSAGTRDKPHDWWAGPALLQILFAQEHNVLYCRLARIYPGLDNHRLHTEARNISFALLEKIHLQWRASMVPASDWHRPLQRLRRVALAHEDVRHSNPSSIDHLLACITPLLPDRFAVRSVVTGTHQGPRGGFGFVALHTPRSREFIEHQGAANLWYSFGIGNAGIFELHNHCTASRRLPVPNSERFENPVASAIKDHRASHPASYNALRQLLSLPPIRHFADLDPRWASDIERSYARVDDIDGLIGMLAERRGADSVLGETAMRCLTVFDRASCRQADLTALGKSWLRENSLQTMLLRHYPVLQDALYGIDDPFARWRPVVLIEPV